MKRQGSSSSAVPKRTRFAESPPSGRAPSLTEGDVDEAFLEDDITTTSRKEKKRERRALKDQDGYGSDSSNDEESVVPNRRPGGKEDADEEVDMFAEEKEDAAADDEAKGKKKAFMDLDEIEGQEFAKRRDEVDDDSDSEAEDVRQGLDGPMGIEMTPFNMKAEMETGKFTADGEEYVENDKDTNDKHDSWLDSVDKDEIKKARRAHRERERVEREREAAEDANDSERKHALMRQAVELMERGETVLEALQRLGKEVEDKRKKDEAGSKKKSWAERQKERKAASEASPFTTLTEIVSSLAAMEQVDVYSLTRESLQRMLPQPANGNSSHASSPRPPPDLRQLQYRFSMDYVRNLPEAQRPVEREVFGPFSAQQLQSWKLTGFFGPSCQNVEVRLVSPSGQEQWGSWASVVGPV